MSSLLLLLLLVDFFALSVSAQCPGGATSSVTCSVNPCAVTTCPVNHACLPNYCHNFPTPGLPACHAACVPIAQTCELQLGQAVALRCGNGTAFPACTDGCNGCTCENNRFTACTLMACMTLATCRAASGQSYSTGQMTQKSKVKTDATNDVANMCVCGPYGGWHCSSLASPSDLPATRPPSPTGDGDGTVTSSPIETRPPHTAAVDPTWNGGGGVMLTRPNIPVYVRITISVSLTETPQWRDSLLVIIKRALGLASESSRIDISFVNCNAQTCTVTIVIQPAQNTLPACPTSSPLPPTWAPIPPTKPPINSGSGTKLPPSVTHNPVSAAVVPPDSADSAGNLATGLPETGSASASGASPVSSGSVSGSDSSSSSSSSSGVGTGVGSTGNTGSSATNTNPSSSTSSTGAASSSSASSTSMIAPCINIVPIFYGAGEVRGGTAIPPASGSGSGGSSSGTVDNTASAPASASSASSLDASSLADVLAAQANDGSSPLRQEVAGIQSGEKMSALTSTAAATAPTNVLIMMTTMLALIVASV